MSERGAAAPARPADAAGGRDALIDAFLADTPWRAARRAPLSADASFRRYIRLHGGPRPALVMDAPPPREDVRPYVKVAAHLGRLGFSAPEVWAADEANGLLVIEDFGDATFTRILARGGDEARLYRGAVDTLIALQRTPGVADIAVPAYDAARLLEEAALLVDWYLPAVTGEAPDPGLRAAYLELWRGVLPLADALPRTLVLRDFHVDNLMWLDRRDGVRACGLLDFQDAVIGAPAYDLVSLVEDARRDVPRALGAEVTARYLDAFPELDREAFGAAAAMLAAQRSAKIIGIFTRLLRRDGKPVYLGHIPRVWRWLEGDLAHPALAPVRAWFDETIPPDRRRVPEPQQV